MLQKGAMCQTAEWLTAIGTIFLGIVALLVALFQEHVRQFWFKPRFHLAASSFAPYCIKKSFLFLPGVAPTEHPHYHLKIRIMNAGNTKAEYAQVFAEDLERQDGHGRFVAVSDFTATYMLWSDQGQTVLDVLNPEMPAYCDIARVFCVDGLPREFASAAMSVKEATVGTRTVLSVAPHVWGPMLSPGYYRLTVKIGAANAKPIKKVLRLNVTGRWPGIEIGPERIGEVLEFGILS